MRRYWSWLVLLVAVGVLALALPNLRTPPAPGQVPGPSPAQTVPVAPASDITVFFSRVEDPRGAIRAALGEARQSVLVAMYTFTDRDLAEALGAARDRGAQVQVYLDRSQAASRYSQARYLVEQGLAVRISSNPNIMHNKFAVVDERVVLTGSYNWTTGAWRDNDENLLRIDRPEIAERYRQRFAELWEQWDPALTETLQSPLGPAEHPERN